MGRSASEDTTAGWEVELGDAPIAERAPKPEPNRSERRQRSLEPNGVGRRGRILGMLNADVDFHVLEQVIPEGSVRHVAGTCKGHGPTIQRPWTKKAFAEQLVDVENKATLYQTARAGSARAARSVPPPSSVPRPGFCRNLRANGRLSDQRLGAAGG